VVAPVTCGWVGSTLKNHEARRRPAVGAHRAPVVVKADVQRQRKRTGLITWPGLCSGRAGCVIAAGLVRSNANAICYIEVMAR
jgi:hypothetical protein